MSITEEAVGLGSVARAGDAKVKEEFLLKETSKKAINLQYVSNEDKSKLLDGGQLSGDEDDCEEPLQKKQKVRLKGQNKNRRAQMHQKNTSVKYCLRYFANLGNGDAINVCSAEDDCKFSHDADGYISAKPSDIGDECYLYQTYGFCSYGALCRFGSKHCSGKENAVDSGKWEEWKPKMQQLTKNQLDHAVQFSLRRKKYDFAKSNTIVKKIHDADVGPVVDVDNVSRLKKIDFRNKLYMAPLTTVGNLPFRRIAKTYGADITCSEMAVGQCLLEGNASEWALMKRHSSEDFFGAQICGASIEVMTKVSQLINENCNVDFIDINMGCPIDMIYRKGAGSGLMARNRRVNDIICGMSSVSKVPITIKIRTGIYENKNVAHKIIESVKQLPENVLGLITLHGRSREQRYTKAADWDYINYCAELADPLPLFGSGDILSYEDYNLRMENPNLAGVMVGRGALIKPWIFTEIKEQRHWDISSSERMDILKTYVNYGLEHWGSDTQGVEKTRKFLLEWLSFAYRYIPVGLLEVLPQKINERPPSYFGRNDLETLMASPSCSDWIKISEMLLGPVPDDFVFLPKHKANAYQT